MPEIFSEEILLIGSKTGSIQISGRHFQILDPILGEANIKKGAIFINCAFLRREYIKQIGESKFTQRNLEIMALPTRALRKADLFCFVNLSSGAAALVDRNSNKSQVDAYSILKRRSEIDFQNESSKVGTNFINCRVYSVSGCYINEFENLALSSFISQALRGNHIHVNSPHSKRAYVDGVDLMAVILCLALQGESLNFDSGGTLISMRDLAETVNKIIGHVDIDVSIGFDAENSYYGDYKAFNSIATSLNQNLLNIEDQIGNTVQAFK
jgi:nucleoside-diphosphate-sugar epimerase